MQLFYVYVLCMGGLPFLGRGSTYTKLSRIMARLMSPYNIWEVSCIEYLRDNPCNIARIICRFTQSQSVQHEA